jgi:DNA-binding IclR family transcriptional regulator
LICRTGADLTASGEKVFCAGRDAAGGKPLGAMVQGIQHSFAELEESGTCGVLGKFQRGAFGVSLPVRVGRQRFIMGLSCGKAQIQPDLVAERKRIAPELKRAAAWLEAKLADFDGEP